MKWFVRESQTRKTIKQKKSDKKQKKRQILMNI